MEEDINLPIPLPVARALNAFLSDFTQEVAFQIQHNNPEVADLAALAAYNGPLTRLRVPTGTVYSYSPVVVSPPEGAVVATGKGRGYWLPVFTPATLQELSSYRQTVDALLNSLNETIENFGDTIVPDGFIDTPKLAKIAVDAINLKPGIITPDKVNFAKIVSKNLFNPADRKSNQFGSYITNTGTIGSLPGYVVSHFIPVLPNTKYTATDNQFIAPFDANYEPILGSDGQGLPGFAVNRPSITITTPANCAYVKLTLMEKDISVFQFQQGESITDYDNYTPFFEGQTSLNQFLKPTKNLYDKEHPGNEDGFYMDEFGAKVPHAGFSISHFIPVVSTAAYVPSREGQFITFFDINYNVIPSTAGRYDRANQYVIAIERAAFVRLSIPTENREEFMFEQGLTPSTPQPFGIIPSQKFYTNPEIVGLRLGWFGTSIPASSGYVEAACRAIGAISVNNCVPSSAMRIKDKNGSYANIDWQNVAYSPCMDLDEKEFLITNWSTLRPTFRNGNTAPAVLSEADKQFIRGCSYVHRLLPYLDGRKPGFDAIVLSIGYNDEPKVGESFAEFTTMPANFLDRNTFLGAANFFIDIIWQYKPKMKIFIEGHFENQLYPAVAGAQQVLADYYGFPLWKLWSDLGWSQRKVRGTQSKWAQAPWSNYTTGANTADDMTALRYNLPDNVHPYSDPTGEAGRKMARVVEKYLRDSL